VGVIEKWARHECGPWGFLTDAGDVPPEEGPVGPVRPPIARECEFSVWDTEEFIEVLREQVPLLTVIFYLQDLKALASELFLGDIKIAVEADPELEEYHYVVFFVRASGDSDEVDARRREWYRRVIALLKKNASRVRLVIDAEE